LARIEFNQVRHAYPPPRGQQPTYALNEIDQVWEDGGAYALLGPSGCGKTTLLSLITGDNHKAYGQDITLFGIRRGSGESVWDIKQKYGQLDTQLHLNYVRGMRVVEVVALAPRPRRRQRERAVGSEQDARNARPRSTVASRRDRQA